MFLASFLFKVVFFFIILGLFFIAYVLFFFLEFTLFCILFLIVVPLFLRVVSVFGLFFAFLLFYYFFGYLLFCAVFFFEFYVVSYLLSNRNSFCVPASFCYSLLSSRKSDVDAHTSLNPVICVCFRIFNVIFLFRT